VGKGEADIYLPASSRYRHGRRPLVGVQVAVGTQREGRELDEVARHDLLGVAVEVAGELAEASRDSFSSLLGRPAALVAVGQAV